MKNLTTERKIINNMNFDFVVSKEDKINKKIISKIERRYISSKIPSFNKK